jgi:hypothetical protein
MNGVVELNAGGKVFHVLKSSLAGIDYFKSRFSAQENLKMDVSGPLFMDTDPKVFTHWLRTIRLEDYKVPKKYAKYVRDLDDYFRAQVSFCKLKQKCKVYPITQNVLSYNNGYRCNVEDLQYKGFTNYDRTERYVGLSPKGVIS